MVGVVQLVEHLVVVQDVAGSSPVTHPTKAVQRCAAFLFRVPAILRPLAPLAQLAEQLTLNQRVVGSSPTRCTKVLVMN